MVAIRDPAVAKEVCSCVDRSTLQLVGVLDPSLKHRMMHWRDRVDVIVTSPADLQWFSRGSPLVRASRCGPSKLVVFLNPTELIDLQRYIRRIGGIVFQHGPPELIARALELATAGYCILPDDLTGARSLDEVRMRQLSRLSEIERRTLELLAEASQTRAIARALDVSYTQAKTLVRAVLIKLRLENRTAGAVFAARSRIMNLNGCSDPVHARSGNRSSSTKGGGPVRDDRT